MDTSSFNIRPEGGYQDPTAWLGAAQRLNPTREPVRCMYSWELCEIIQKYKHPRFDSAGIWATRHGANPRKEVCLEEHGTVWFTKPGERRWTYSIPYGCIPYSTIRTASWHEEKRRWENGLLLRGWRSLISMLVRTGYLRPDPYLSHLIGEDTYQLGAKFCRR